jgi:hypothetical protein
MINSNQAAFVIWLRVPRCALTVELNKFGKDHNVLELDDIITHSWARLDANLVSPGKLVVHQLGPRRLWDEAEAAYDWRYEHGKPGLTRFGMTATTDSQTVRLDQPSTIIRAFNLRVNQRASTAHQTSETCAQHHHVRSRTRYVAQHSTLGNEVGELWWTTRRLTDDRHHRGGPDCTPSPA